jgi:hypothetical protein
VLLNSETCYCYTANVTVIAFENATSVMLLCLSNSGPYILLYLANLGSICSTVHGCSRINLFLYMHKNMQFDSVILQECFFTVCVIRIVV